MSKNLTLSLILIISIPIIIFIFFQKKKEIVFSSIEIRLNQNSYQLEIASTFSQKAIGLSKRNSLCPNCGMIFIFNKEGTLPFWMKDTLIPLDMIWLNSKGQITDIITADQINSTQILQNTQPAQYVIELNAGDAQKIKLKTGDIVDLSKLNGQ